LKTELKESAPVFFGEKIVNLN